MSEISDIFNNNIFRIVAISWILAQLIKVMINLFVTKKMDYSRLLGMGGMPSSHAAFVTSLAVSVGRTEGFGSTPFAISLALALIVMYDASGVRRAAGEHAKILNQLLEQWFMQEGDPVVVQKKLKELLGHSPLEVVGGAVLGVVMGSVL